MRHKFLVQMLLGFVLLFIANEMRTARNTWTERIAESHASGGTKMRNAAIGSGVGAGLGLVTSLVVGGIGLATGGLGIAIGAVGMTIIGASGGAVVGAATGRSDSSMTIVRDVVHSAPTFENWMWIATGAIGVLLIISACVEPQQTVQESDESLSRSA